MTANLLALQSSRPVRMPFFNTVKLRAAALTFLIALLFCVAPAFSADTTGQDIGKKLDDTGKAIKDYSAEHRDEALKNAKKLLIEADAKIDAFEDDLSRKWDKMDAGARSHAQEAMRNMRRHRQDLSESYGELKRSSSKAWDEVKGGFAKSYDALKDSFSKAAKEF